MPCKDVERIRAEVVAALSALTCVRRIDSFGSIAIGSFDEWSDLDLLVSCEGTETPWLAAAVIRSLRKVAFYRMFTGVPQPSGRYWFCGESPFRRLDVSFHSPAEHERVCLAGVRQGHPVNVHPEYVAQRSPDGAADARLLSPMHPVKVTAQETEVGRLLYNHLETAKEHLRGRQAKRSIAESRAALLHAASQTPMMVGGGDLVSFIAYVDEFIQRALN